jgi:hypothetical protein
VHNYFVVVHMNSFVLKVIFCQAFVASSRVESHEKPFVCRQSRGQRRSVPCNAVQPIL